MVDFKSIETFLWVVTLGSFRGAAQRLNTTQPAISQRIAQLEREMGVKLLSREHRMASPTPSGRQLMVYAEKLIGLRSEMMAEVGDRSATRGVMRLGVAETIVHTWLPRLIKSVNTAYPNLSLEIEVDITPNLSARLLAQEIELAFVLGPLSVSSVRNRPLCDYPIGFLASPSLATVIHMAIEGLGIAVIPTAIVENELADGRLQLLSTDLKISPLTFSASWLASPDTVAVELVADLASKIAQSSALVDAPPLAGH